MLTLEILNKWTEGVPLHEGKPEAEEYLKQCYSDYERAVKEVRGSDIPVNSTRLLRAYVLVFRASNFSNEGIISFFNKFGVLDTFMHNSFIEGLDKREIRIIGAISSMNNLMKYYIKKTHPNLEEYFLGLPSILQDKE